MLELSPAAGEQLVQLLNDVGAPDDVAVRLELKRRRTLALRLDHAHRMDRRLSHAGRMVLLLGRRVARVLDWQPLQLDVEPSGNSLYLTRCQQ